MRAFPLLIAAGLLASAQQPSANPPTSLPTPASANPAVAGAQFGGNMMSQSNSGERIQLVSIPIPPINDAPFSLTLLTTWKMPSAGPVRQLNDNPFYNSRRIMRDVWGRTYQERWSMARDLPESPGNTNLNEPKPQMMSIEISDPIAHVSYNCIIRERVCRQSDYRPAATAGSATDEGNSSLQTSKSIGTRTIQGVKADGYQVTTTYASGASGVTRRTSEVREFWYAPRLGIDLQAELKSSDVGDQKFQVKDIATREPDPRYFTVPTGYQVIDRRGSAAQQAGVTAQPAGSLKTRGAQSTEAAPPNPAPVPPAVPTIRTTARIVVLDVVAVDAHGQPVKGLKASDFVLSENGVPQTLQSFIERDAAVDQPALPAEPTLPPNTFANHAPVVNETAMTVLLFDTSGLSFGDAAYARDEVAAYLKKVKPGTPMCIFDLDQWDGLRLIQDFTTDTAVLRKAVESKQNAQKPWQFPEFTPSLQLGIAMRELARYLAGFPGRKNLIWFYGTQPPQIAMGQPGLYPDIMTARDGGFAGDLSGLAESLTLNRVVLYPVDPRGVIFRWNLIQNIYEQDNIFFQGGDASDAAGATGGKTFVNSNTISKDVSEIVAAGSHYYTVSYTPTNAHWDGGFRRLQVRFTGGSTSTGLPTAKLHLDYRNGYYAQDAAPPRRIPLPGAQVRRLISYSPLAASSNPTLADAMHLGAITPFEILFSAHITPNPSLERVTHDERAPEGNYLTQQWLHEPYRNYAIHYSVDPDDIELLKVADGLYRDTVEFVAVLYDNYDHVVNSFINSVPLEVNAKDYEEIKRTGVGIEIPIAVPAKGDYYLRLGVHDLNSDHVGALEIPVSEIALSGTQGKARK